MFGTPKGLFITQPMSFSDAYDVVARYPSSWLSIAESRGWRRDAHITALMDGNEDAITLTHPANELTEDEVEAG